MMNRSCILTNKDFTILERLRERSQGTDDPLAPILKAKIDTAVVMFHNDVPPNIVTLNSRITFTVNGSAEDSRVITMDRSQSPVGMSLPITSARGLALLGLSEGQSFLLVGQQGEDEQIVLQKVLYQPEAARREKEALQNPPARIRNRPALTLVRGTLDDHLTNETGKGSGIDDPGPSAA